MLLVRKLAVERKAIWGWLVVLQLLLVFSVAFLNQSWDFGSGLCSSFFGDHLCLSSEGLQLSVELCFLTPAILSMILAFPDHERKKYRFSMDPNFKKILLFEVFVLAISVVVLFVFDLKLVTRSEFAAVGYLIVINLVLLDVYYSAAKILLKRVSRAWLFQ